MNWGQAFNGAIDGCGIKCEGCGIKKQPEKVLFGRKVILEYTCGMKPGHVVREYFVSFLGTVHLKND